MLLTREQLQEKLIALHEASLELVKNVTLEHLLERIVAVACEQAEARYAALGVLDDQGRLAKFITVGMTEKQIQRLPHPPVGKGLIGELMDTEEPLRLPVLQEHPRSVGFPENHPQMASFLGVPIRVGDRQLGQIYLTEKIGASEFSAEDERIIQMLATYAGAAIQNARLVHGMTERDLALTQRTADMTLLNEIASTLTSSLELDKILNRTLGLVMDYIHAESGEIFLLNEDKSTLRMVLHRGEAADAFWTRKLFRMGEGFIGLSAEKREALVSHHLARDTRFLRKEVIRAGFNQIACIPLMSGENLMGVLSVATRQAEPLEERSVQLLTAVGTWAGLAIENARLHANVRQLAVLAERERIGMDLHDGIIQSIYGVGLTLENTLHALDSAPGNAQERVRQAIDGLNQVIRDLRSYILDLKPRQLGDEGLIQGLKRLVTEFRANTFAEVHLSGSEDELESLPPESARALFHISQEVLANAAKHAKAKNVQIALWTTDDRVLMEIHDDGIGFDIEKMNSSIGHGLGNMQTRAHAVGGDVDISSVPGEGTTVLTWIPRRAPE